VRSSAREHFAAQRAENRANADQALADLKAIGVTVESISEAERAAWAKLTEPLFAEFGAKSPETKAMIDKIRALA
jgi:C4-dicarboxylate-binding protein DctP